MEQPPTSIHLSPMPQLLWLSCGYGMQGLATGLCLPYLCSSCFCRGQMQKRNRFNLLLHSALFYPSDHFICPSSDLSQLHFLPFKVHQPEPHGVRMYSFVQRHCPWSSWERQCSYPKKRQILGLEASNSMRNEKERGARHLNNNYSSFLCQFSYPFILSSISSGKQHELMTRPYQKSCKALGAAEMFVNICWSIQQPTAFWKEFSLSLSIPL